MSAIATPEASPPTTYLSRDEAAAYLSERLRHEINPKQMAGWGLRGPRYSLFRGSQTSKRGGMGRWALYTVEDLEVWIKTQVREPISTLDEVSANGHDKLAGPSE